LLEGEAALLARATAQEIVSLLASPPEPEGATAADRASLARGRAGLGLLHDYSSNVMGTDPAPAVALLDESSELISSEPMGPGLFTGFAGVGWTATYLRGEAEADDACEEMDEALVGFLRRGSSRDGFDLINGLAGIGVYFLERSQVPAAGEGIRLVVERLAETGEPNRDGLAWPVPQVARGDATGIGRPRYDVGVAHGVPGLVGFLSAVERTTFASDGSRSLLEGAVRWVLAQRAADGSFPSFAGQGADPVPARSAWCYGSPGIAAALLAAGIATEVEEWISVAVEVARAVALRPEKASGVVDAGLCHGAAGLAHLLNRLYQATGDDQLRAGALRWYDRTLAMRRPDRGVGGYPAWIPPLHRDSGGGWVDEPGFLGGAAGVALALLAGVSTEDPNWDRVLLLSGPGRE
jgi:lantibiotic modifying enzyme